MCIISKKSKLIWCFLIELNNYKSTTKNSSSLANLLPRKFSQRWIFLWTVIRSWKNLSHIFILTVLWNLALHNLSKCVSVCLFCLISSLSSQHARNAAGWASWVNHWDWMVNKNTRVCRSTNDYQYPLTKIWSTLHCQNARELKLSEFPAVCLKGRFSMFKQIHHCCCIDQKICSSCIPWCHSDDVVKKELHIFSAWISSLLLWVARGCARWVFLCCDTMFWPTKQ